MEKMVGRKEATVIPVFLNSSAKSTRLWAPKHLDRARQLGQLLAHSKQ
jgi:hypothetical protein